MLVKSRLIAGVLLLSGGVAMAADDDLPDVEFLEYLGSWEESDEDWVMIDKESQKERKKKDKRDDPEPEGEESAEIDDEW